MVKALFLCSLKVVCWGKKEGTLFQVLGLEMKHPKKTCYCPYFLFSANNKLGTVHIKNSTKNIKVELLKMHCNNSLI